MAARYQNRADAGRKLAQALQAYNDNADAIVLALPRGGVPVAYEVAHALHLPLDVMTVRKLGTPGHPEMAMGAIASGGVRVLNQSVIRWLQLSNDEVDEVIDAERRELQRRESLYRAGHPPLDLKDRTVILVDDGLATGATMQAAVFAAGQQHPTRVIVAVPVASQEACETLRQEADDIVCLQTPSEFQAVGAWYVNFDQTMDEQVQSLMQRANDAPAPS